MRAEPSHDAEVAVHPRWEFLWAVVPCYVMGIALLNTARGDWTRYRQAQAHLRQTAGTMYKLAESSGARPPVPNSSDRGTAIFAALMSLVPLSVSFLCAGLVVIDYGRVAQSLAEVVWVMAVAAGLKLLRWANW